MLKKSIQVNGQWSWIVSQFEFSLDIDNAMR